MFGMPFGFKTWAFALLILLIIFGGVKAVVTSRRAKNKPKTPTPASWKSYLKGQGVVLCSFLFLGISLGWISSYFHPSQGTITKGGKLIEYRHIDLTQGPFYKDLDTEHCSSVTIVTSASAPENGVGTVTIYAEDEGSHKSAITRLDTLITSWSRWEVDSPPKRLSISVTGATKTGTSSATQVELLIYLTPE
jgi:hypothetical protein